MPVIKSAKKRVRLAQKAAVRNTKTKRIMRDSIKAFSKAVSSGKPPEIAKAQKAALSAIDKAAKKAVIHKNKAARKKAQLAALAKAADAKPVKKTVKRPAKATVKKPSGKPSAKKAK